MADSTDRPNKVTITDAGPCTKKVAIEIPAETVNERLGNSIDTLMSEAALPGFRKGHAPKRLIERKFGSSIRSEAKNQLVASAVSKALDEHKLRVVGDATSDTLEKLELVEGKPLKFEVEVEIVPEFEMPKLEGIEVKKPLFEVTDKMVEEEVDRMTLNEGTLKSKDKIDLGDYLTGHAVMKDDEGKTILDINDAVIQVPTKDKNGKGMILGVVVDDFAKQLGTPKIDSTCTINTNGPENHEDERIRGKKLVISFQIKRADEIVKADVNELAQRYGMESADQLKDAVRQRIDQRIQIDQQAAMRNQVAAYLLDNTSFELPKRMTNSQAARNLDRSRMELMYRGVDQQKIEERIAELRAASSAAAARDLKLFFILDRAAEKLDVKVSEAELNGRIAQMALSRGDRPERLRQEIIQKNQVGMVYGQVREHKTLDAVIAKANINDISVDDYNKLMDAQNKKAREEFEKKSKG